MSCHAAKGALLTTASGKGRSRASSRRRCEEGLSRCGGGGRCRGVCRRLWGCGPGPSQRGGGSTPNRGTASARRDAVAVA